MSHSVKIHSVLLTNNEEVVNCLIHRLQMLHIIKLYQERQSLVLMQITERSLSCHGEALPKGIYARRQERNLILSSFVNGACHLFNLWWRGRRSDPTYFLINIIILGQRVKLYVGIVNQSGFYYKRPLVVGKSFEGDIASHGLHEFAA